MLEIFCFFNEILLKLFMNDLIKKLFLLLCSKTENGAHKQPTQ
jgi:hypothetical protein